MHGVSPVSQVNARLAVYCCHYRRERICMVMPAEAQSAILVSTSASRFAGDISPSRQAARISPTRRPVTAFFHVDMRDLAVTNGANGFRAFDETVKQRQAWGD